MPFATAMLAKRAFSAGEGRAVMDGRGDGSPRVLMDGFRGSNADKDCLMNCSRATRRSVAEERTN
jgi:hypothetical protein